MDRLAELYNMAKPPIVETLKKVNTLASSSSFYGVLATQTPISESQKATHIIRKITER